MEIDVGYLRSVFDPLRIRHGSEFEYLDTPFAVWLHRYTKQDKEEGEHPIFCAPSTVTDGYDIYMPFQLKAKFRKPAAVHETIEAVAMNWFGRNSPKSTLEEDRFKAHDIARHIDEWYAKETLSGEEFREYLLMKKRYCEYTAGKNET